MSALAKRLDVRSRDRLRAHYEIECELADRLRRASASERSALYSEVYDELFARVPDHPQLVIKSSAAERAAAARDEAAFLSRFLTPEMTVLEVGAGDCAVSRALAKHVRDVVAVDVSQSIASGDLPSNVTLQISDGRTQPAGDRTIDLAYSNQLLEHLHPEDAVLHAREIRRVLKPGGVYVCFTPNPLNGPHDISRDYDPEARGFHLKEYTTGGLVRLFKGAGFSRVQLVVKVKSRAVVLPCQPVVTLERALGLLPLGPRRAVARSVFVRKLLGRVVATA